MKRQSAEEIAGLENELESLRQQLGDRRDGPRRTQQERRAEQTPAFRNGLRVKLWIATGCAAVLLPVVAYLETEWRHTVGDAVKQVPQLQAVTSVNASAISELASDLKEQRKETAEFYMFVYQRLGYVEGAEAMKQTLERLGAPLLPPPSPKPRQPATLK